jgi:L-amino acid N-acyltransferase YncA
MSATTAEISVTIRDASPDDAEAICRVYNQGIEDRVATLETECRTPEERHEWMAARGPRHPVLVADSDGVVTGWASLNRFNPRPAYDHVADLSVYVERAWRGRGVGRALLAALIERGRLLGYHKLVLAAFPDNAAGMALYARLGFTRVGVYREQGQLDGRWVDVVVMERLLCPDMASIPPSARDVPAKPSDTPTGG